MESTSSLLRLPLLVTGPDASTGCCSLRDERAGRLPAIALLYRVYTHDDKLRCSCMFGGVIDGGGFDAIFDILIQKSRFGSR